ncbi:MAG: hypothetical protein M1824_001839 [Vezdaea acicularis]|nr:MAG: hypothetical protein M1824_001839 [Vezdaea acicularis]
MPAMARIAYLSLRVGELAFAATVAGLIGQYLHQVDEANGHPGKRFVYTEVIAGLSILLALIWLLPFTAGFIHYPVDFVMFILWIVAFGLLVNFIGPLHCGSIWAWGDITDKGTCQKWKASVAFSFLSAVFWLASAILGIYVIHRARRGTVAARDDGALGTHGTRSRRRWYRNSRV